MSPKLENLIALLAKTSLNHHDFLQLAGDISEITSLFNPRDFDMWRFLGLNLMKLDNGKITLKTRETDICDEIFCIVDIETSGGIHGGQIIEIGAVKVQNFKEIGRFCSFAKANEIPAEITELTGISVADVASAPSLANVREKFRLFLGNAVFVAHNVRFDYDFISATLEKFGFGMLLNRRICTIELARRTIAAQKYGLQSLKDQLGIKNKHHRALSDALACRAIFETSIKRLPWHVQTSEDLITFSKIAPCMKIIEIKG